MPLFQQYVMVDWSAAASPKKGADSIWYAHYICDEDGLRRVALENPTTRAAATGALADLLAGALAQDEDSRVLVGFDFPFGYPKGTAEALGLTGLLWRQLWSFLSERIEDDDRNANNRLPVAAALNRQLSEGGFPFWGHPHGQVHDGLPTRKPANYGGDRLAERRLIENRVPGAKTVWQLNGAGSVGGQVLTGIPRVWQLRTDPRLAFTTQIWPFETGLDDQPQARIVLAEAYPSIVAPLVLEGLPKDAGQVCALAEHLAGEDSADRLLELMQGGKIGDDKRRIIELEEAWILGITGERAP